MGDKERYYMEEDVKQYIELVPMEMLLRWHEEANKYFTDYLSSKQSKNQRTLKVENGQPIAPDFTMEELEYSTKHKDKL